MMGLFPDLKKQEPEMMGLFPDLKKQVEVPKVEEVPKEVAVPKQAAKANHKAPPISLRREAPMPWPMTAPLIPTPSPPPPPPPPPPVAPVTRQKKQSRSVSLELVDLRVLDAEADEVDWGGDESDELPQSPKHLYPRTPTPEFMVERQFPPIEEYSETPIHMHPKLVTEQHRASNQEHRGTTSISHPS
jgi:hypothetical protein